MTIIFPTVGRKVWYHPSETDTMVRREQPLDATIVYVWSDRMVNLVVFDSNGCMYARTSVKLLQDIDRRPKDGTAYAEWMPYQKGKAKATDKAEKALAEVAVEKVAAVVPIVEKVVVAHIATEAAKEAVVEGIKNVALSGEKDKQ